MKRHELLLMIALAIGSITAGFVWWVGFYGLIGCGAILLIASWFIDVREG